MERMTTWLIDWYGKGLPGTDNLTLWLAGLKGAQFEREFLKQYSINTSMRLTPIKACSSKAAHVEPRELCQRIAPKQQKQVEQLRQWRLLLVWRL